jgi:hypothetical protein
MKQIIFLSVFLLGTSFGKNLEEDDIWTAFKTGEHFLKLLFLLHTKA